MTMRELNDVAELVGWLVIVGVAAIGAYYAMYEYLTNLILLWRTKQHLVTIYGIWICITMLSVAALTPLMQARHPLEIAVEAIIKAFAYGCGTLSIIGTVLIIFYESPKSE